MGNSNPPQHKLMAMGKKVTGMKAGGVVSAGVPAKPASLKPTFNKTGIKDTPLESSKRANKIPGMKKGGRC